MPFMIGKAPIRRTLEYITKCKIFLRDNVKIFSISYSPTEKHHSGARDFVFWNFPQLQYANPTVQFVELEDLTSTPFIKVYFVDKDPVIIDLDSRTREEIQDHLANLTLISKTEKELRKDKEVKGSKDASNPTFFGSGCLRHCLCEIFGQIPCPSIVPVPYKMRGTRPKHSVLSIPDHIKMWAEERKKSEQTQS